MTPPGTSQLAPQGMPRQRALATACLGCVAWVVTGAAVLLAGCATQDGAQQSPRPGSGIAEYQQLVSKSLKLIGRAASSLDRVAAQTNQCPPRLVASFSSEVQRLQAESITVRARSQAIQARGDAYFQRWQENLAQIRKAGVRQAAEQNRPQLQVCFARIKEGSQQAGEAFRPFLSGLRALQNALEADPRCVGAEPTRKLLHSTREKSNEVTEALTVIERELGVMSGLLMPVTPAGIH